MKTSFLVILIFVIEFSCQSSPHAPSLRPEQKLAVLDHLDTADQRVIEIVQLLEKLSKKYKEPTDTIAMYTSKAQDVLKSFKITKTNQEILEGVNQLSLSDSISYQAAVTAYVLGGR